MVSETLLPMPLQVLFCPGDEDREDEDDYDEGDYGVGDYAQDYVDDYEAYDSYGDGDYQDGGDGRGIRDGEAKQ